MKYLLLLFFTGVLLLTGCTDSGVNVSSEKEAFMLEGDTPIPSQENTSWWVVTAGDKAKSAKLGLATLSTEQVSELYKILDGYSQKKSTPYVAFLSKKKKNNDEKKFKYRYFKLKPNQKDIEESGGERMFYYHIFVDPSDNEIYQILAVIIPNTEEQIASVKAWGGKLNGNSSQGASVNARNKVQSCTYEEGLTWEPLCGCFSIGTVEVCAPADDNDAIDDGGSGGTDGGCYYTAGECDEEPLYPPGGGAGDDPEPESCPAGQVEDVNGNCITGEVPCVGNPVKNPRIAEQKQNFGVDGGRFTVGDDAVRDAGNTDHKGLDLLVGHGEPLFTMKDGKVEAIGNSFDFGKYVIVSYDINGEDVWMLYGHLNTANVVSGTSISQGTVIGTVEISGNLAGAIRDGYAYQHVHMETRIGGWSGTPKDPEDYITTQFDSNGNPVSGTDC